MIRALACDYDGTLAARDTMPVAAVDALALARARGLRTILVTGRAFFELTRVCERLDLFDVVVAENGGVLYYPQAAMIREQAPPPPPRFLAELDRRGIAYQLGRVVVGTARADEPSVRAALGATGVALNVVYNRAAMMLLPVGIDKGSGARHAIRALGLSFHDVLAMGDAENDLALLEACGWAGCPDNAVAELKERADWVFPGANGEAVARAIAGPILGGALPLDRSLRHRVPLGWALGTLEAVAIPERGVNVLVHGDVGSGKSWLAGALVERLVARRYAVCVIDPEGDYRVLRALPQVRWREIRGPEGFQALLRHLDEDPEACLVGDLSALPRARRVEVTGQALEMIRAQRLRNGLPHWVVIDEAHEALAAPPGAEAARIDDRGLCLVTYRPSWLPPGALDTMNVVLLARSTVPDELAVLSSIVAGARGTERIASVAPDLGQGQFVVIQPDGAGGRMALTFTAAPRETLHVRHLRKYADTRVPIERAFFFRDDAEHVVDVAESLGEFRRVLGAVAAPVLAYHARRGDFSRWVREVFADDELARAMAKAEQRWRRGEGHDLRAALDRPLALRYGLDELPP